MRNRIERRFVSRLIFFGFITLGSGAYAFKLSDLPPPPPTSSPVYTLYGQAKEIRYALETWLSPAFGGYIYRRLEKVPDLSMQLDQMASFYELLVEKIKSESPEPLLLDIGFELVGHSITFNNSHAYLLRALGKRSVSHDLLAVVERRRSVLDAQIKDLVEAARKIDKGMDPGEVLRMLEGFRKESEVWTERFKKMEAAAEHDSNLSCSPLLIE